MLLIHQDEFVSTSFDETNNLLLEVWTTRTENMSDEQFQKYLYIWRDAMLSNQIEYVLTDTTNFRISISADMQTWIVEHITGLVAKNSAFKKQAFIMPTEFFANLSVEQFSDESNQNATQTKYFSDMTSAQKWLLG